MEVDVIHFVHSKYHCVGEWHVILHNTEWSELLVFKVIKNELFVKSFLHRRDVRTVNWNLSVITDVLVAWKLIKNQYK